MAHNAQRKNYMIDPAFQLRFAMRFCAIVLTASLAIAFAMLFVLKGSTTVAIENTKVIVKPTIDVIFPHLALTLLIAMIFSSLAVVVIAVLFSHKISGPIYRLKSEINFVKEGDLTRNFKIRDGDQLQDLATSLEGMSEALRQKHLELGGQCRAITNFLDDKDFSASDSDRERLHTMLKDLYEVLNYFKV